MYHDRLCTAHINLITELLVGLLISTTVLFFMLGKIFNWGFIMNNAKLASVVLNWLLILPLSINFLMFTFAECTKGMSSI